MRRRSVASGSPAHQVPYDLAIGPHVPTWANPPQVLIRDHPATPQEVTGDAMVTAYRTWDAARSRWFAEHNIPREQQCALIPFRQPYSGEPRLPRTGLESGRLVP